ncbi:MAG: hydroxymethylglutaryl-CoA synthase family protein [Acetivibrionales bacterium]|jgi:polyketide biosynthesis 3-hydroxy-3-methylglutaryl-CoA synthase-like enzyme PksG
MCVGIEAINVYAGVACMDVRTLFKERNLNLERFDNLMMEKKSVGLPCEDPVTNAVNAAKPLVERLSAREKNRIELLIIASESGIDFGKSIGTYVHQYLGLGRNCRIFEVKQACYGGTAAFHMAVCFIASNASPGAKALVIATDTARTADRMTYAEPSQGTGAVAMIVSNVPDIMEIDFGASGCCSYEVMDTCRPLPDKEVGNPDLSLLSYLDCLENSYRVYADKVEGANFAETFDYLAFHTPFCGMVKGAHRKMMRQFAKADPDMIEADFRKRVVPSLEYCLKVGNVYSATLYIALCSLIDNAKFEGVRRVGLFSYGSGCSSEFYSGLISMCSKVLLAEMNIGGEIARRCELSIQEYEQLLELNSEWAFGIRNKEADMSQYSRIYREHAEGRGLLVLKRVCDYHREYVWS